MCAPAGAAIFPVSRLQPDQEFWQSASLPRDRTRLCGAARASERGAHDALHRKHLRQNRPRRQMLRVPAPFVLQFAPEHRESLRRSRGLLPDGPALGRNAVELPRTLLLHAGVTDLMQVSQRGINHTWAGRIESARTFFYRLDQFVSVRWLFGEQRQYHQLNVDRVELAAAGKIATGEVAHKSGASTTETAAPVMTSVSSRVFSAVFAVVFATVFSSVSSGVLSVVFSTVFAAEAAIETC